MAGTGASPAVASGDAPTRCCATTGYDAKASVSSLIPRRWTHGDELESGALRPRSVVVHLIRDIVDYAPRPDSNGVVLIELRPRADQEGSRQHGDESLIRMRV